MDPFDRLILAESRLETAAKEFLASCSYLLAAGSTLNWAPAMQGEIDRKIKQLRGRENSLASTEKQFLVSRAMLDTIFALFPPPASIQRIPSELLSRIFSYAIPRCRSSWAYEPEGLLAITVVCRRWRQVAIQTPSLWSHIDLDIGLYQYRLPPHRLDKIWLERAKGHPLHVHFQCHLSEMLDRAPRCTAFPDLVAMIVPYASQIATLEFLGFGAKHIAQTLSEIRHAQTSTNLLTGLYIVGSEESGVVGYDDSSRDPVSWSPTLFKDISELVVSFLPEEECPTLSQLVAILNNCPALHSLALNNVTIRDDDSGSDCLMVHVCDLRFLSLHHVVETGSQKLLAILHPGRTEVHLEVDGVYDDSSALISTTEFISRFLVTSIYLRSPLGYDGAENQIIDYLSSVPSVHTLLLSPGCNAEATLKYLMTVNVHGIRIPRLPHLKTLCLLNTEFQSNDIDALEKLVAEYALRKLLLVLCGPRVLGYNKEQVQEEVTRKYHSMVRSVPWQVPEVVLLGGAARYVNRMHSIYLRKDLLDIKC